MLWGVGVAGGVLRLLTELDQALTQGRGCG